MPGDLSVEPGCKRIPEFVLVVDMAEMEHDFRGAGAVDGCNALSDALIELGLLSGPVCGRGSSPIAILQAPHPSRTGRMRCFHAI